jgi:hypothetical protein
MRFEAGDYGQPRKNSHRDRIVAGDQTDAATITERILNIDGGSHLAAGN